MRNNNKCYYLNDITSLKYVFAIYKYIYDNIRHINIVCVCVCVFVYMCIIFRRGLVILSKVALNACIKSILLHHSPDFRNN